MINQQARRWGVERCHCTPHGGSGGGQQAPLIDLRSGGLADSDRHRYPADLLIAAISCGRGKLLRVAHFRQHTRQIGTVQRQHHRSRYDRPSQSPAPGFINAGNVTAAALELCQFTLEVRLHPHGSIRVGTTDRTVEPLPPGTADPEKIAEHEERITDHTHSAPGKVIPVDGDFFHPVP